MRRTRATVPVAAIAALAVLSLVVACRPDVVVRLTTRVFVDGSLERGVSIRGRTSEGEVPTDATWFRNTARIELAQPESWPRVERRADRIEAAGFFANVESVPPILSFHTDIGKRDDPSRVELTIEKRGVLRRWSYLEIHGDPFGAANRTAALQALTERAVQLLRDELRESAGPDFDSWPAEAFLREEGVGLAQSLLQWRRMHSGLARRAERVAGYARILRQAGVRGIETDPGDGFWEAALPKLLNWAQDEIADRLAAEHGPLPERTLDFWPAGDGFSERAEALVRRHWGEDDALWEEIAPHIEALAGRHSGELGTRFRFEVQTVLPGTLLHTNGTPAAGGVAWLFRESDLSSGEIQLRAVSAEALPETLIALGARRDLDTGELLQLEDLLWRRDPEGILAGRLESAIHAGSLDSLREPTGEEDLWIDLARELAELLQP